MNHIGLFLSVQALVFGAAALVHAGALLPGYEHREAMIAEAVIAGALLLALIGVVTSPTWSRAFGLGAQAFALLGTFVGLFTIMIGVGPQTGVDLVLHAGMVVLLITGLIVVARAERPHQV